VKIPFLYLGLPIWGNPRKKHFWQTIVSKVRSRLSSWKGKLLSMAGRVYLIKSVISSWKGNLDTWSWKEIVEGAYTKRSTYMKLMGSYEGESNKVFTELWSIRVIPKAQLFGWRLLLDKLPTKDKLSVKGVQLQHSLCELCLDCEESASHLFFSCTMSQRCGKCVIAG